MAALKRGAVWRRFGAESWTASAFGLPLAVQRPSRARQWRLSLVRIGPSPVPDTCGCLSLLKPTLPTTPLRRAAAARRDPARGRAASRTIIATVTIKIAHITMDVADTQFQVTLAEPFVDTLANLNDVNHGARALGAATTPRQFRPPANWIWLGGAWMLWTAPLRRGLHHGVCMNLVDTREVRLNLFRGPRARGGVRTMAMAIEEKANPDSPEEDSHLMLEKLPRGRNKKEEERTLVVSRRRIDFAKPQGKKANVETESKCSLALTSPRLPPRGRRA